MREGMGGRGGVGSRRRAKATIWTQAAVLCPSVWDQNWYNPQGGPRLPLGAAWYPMQPYWCPLGLRNASSWFNSIGKKPSVKADLAIYDQVLGVSE